MGSATRIRPGYIGAYPASRSPGTGPASAGSARYPDSGGVPLPPGTPLLWYAADNSDGLGNTTRVDATAFSPWKNLGSKSGADISNIGGLRPAWAAIGGVGKINNMPAVVGTGTQYLHSAVLSPTQAQPVTFGVIFMSVDVTGTEVIFQCSDSGANQIQVSHIGGAHVWLSAGGNVDTGISLQSGKWHMLTCEFNGASTILRLDGTQSGPYNPGTALLGGVALFAQDSGGFPLTGRIAEWIAYPTASMSAANLEPYFRDKYGSVFPQ